MKTPVLRLRTKLALVALVLLALPWAGYRYVREMDFNFLYNIITPHVMRYHMHLYQALSHPIIYRLKNLFLNHL